MTTHSARREDIDLDIPFAQFIRPFDEEEADVMPYVGQSLWMGQPQGYRFSLPCAGCKYQKAHHQS